MSSATTPGSPGERIAFTATGSAGNIFTINPDGTDLRKLVSSASGPVWSPDRSRLAFTRLLAHLASRDGGAVCGYCGHRHKLRRLTVDHVIPLSRGGDNALTNLVLACKPCNTAKGDQVWKETP